MRVLIVDSNLVFARKLANVLKEELTAECEVVNNHYALERRLKTFQYDCVVADVLAAYNADEILNILKSVNVPKIVFTVPGNFKSAHTVLLVEPDDAAANEFMRAFAKYKIKNEILRLKTCSEVIQLLHGPEAQPANKYSVMLLDTHSDQTDELRLIKALRADERTRNMPIIVFSGTAGCPTQELFDRGACSLITKPVDFASFAEMLIKLGLCYAELFEVDSPTRYMRKPSGSSEFLAAASSVGDFISEAAITS